MRVAQDLYEGIDIGPEGAVGLITYMRTDSTRVAESAATQAQDYLRVLFGKEFLAKGIQLYGDGKSKNAQDAHESVRPTDPTRRPDDIRKYLSPDQFKLYQLIWQRFMGSQMAPAVFDTTTVDFDIPAREQPQIGRRSYLFRSTGSIIKFQGFLALYREAREEGDSKALEDEKALPVVDVGENIPVQSITPSQHFTEPPPRFSEASLVKELERLGIGRPSTYASIISVLADRRYVNLEQRRFFPTELGETVEKVMVKQFPDIFNVDFTSGMELELDKVEEGELGWRVVLKDFWGPFDKSLKNVQFGALIAVAHDLSALEHERCPDRRRASRAARRILRAVPRLRESSEDVQVYPTAQGREGEAADDGHPLPPVRTADGRSCRDAVANSSAAARFRSVAARAPCPRVSSVPRMAASSSSAARRSAGRRSTRAPTRRAISSRGTSRSRRSVPSADTSAPK